MPSLSATEVAFLMVAFQQGVLACGWLVGATLMPDSRRACRHWAAYAALSAVALVLILGSVRPGDGLLRAAGNLSVVASLLIMHRGVRSFFGEPHPSRGHLAIGIAALAASVVGIHPAHGGLRVAAISGLLALVCFWVARDLHVAARRHIDLRWAVMLALPVALAGLAFAFRAGRALNNPGTVVALVSSDNVLSVGAAAAYLVIGLIFQLTLVALVVARLLDKLDHASRFDTLTGLMNRRAIEEALLAEIGRAHRLRATFSVLMIDADHFKAINDGAGHAAGDQALQHLGKLLGTLLRDIDRASRWGGEEFLVLLPGTGQAGALQIAERLRERAQAQPPRWMERELTLTLSIGVAQWRGDADTMPALLARADAALYRAKGTGRNRVEADGGGLAAAA